MPRHGFITGSAFNTCMTKAFGATVKKYCCKIACERLGVRHLRDQFDISGVKAIDWGNENEALAVAAYEADQFVEIHSKQLFQQVPGMFVGGTCDGLVGTDGMVEIKCPNSDNHLLNISHNEQVEKYKYQIQAYLWIYGRDWTDFISFDPRFPDDLQLHVHRIERDESIIDQIKARAVEMEDFISNMIEKARPGFVFEPIETTQTKGK